MHIDLKGRVAVITGAAKQGLGRAHAQTLGRAGCRVAIIDIQDQAETLALLTQDGVKVRAYSCDISQQDGVKKTVQDIVKDFGTIHILVNNASILTTVGMFAEIPVEKWDRDIEVNLVGSANMSRAVWPHLLKNKWGRIVFISSIAGTRGGSGQTSYAASKAGVIGLAKSLALEGARHNITVNAIAPGVIQTHVLNFIRADMLERMRKSIPMQRFGEPEDIANAVTFLCSEQARYITGQVLEVDGGSGLFVF